MIADKGCTREDGQQAAELRCTKQHKFNELLWNTFIVFLILSVLSGTDLWYFGD